MSPHSANEETNNGKKNPKSKAVEGEISIDHSPKPPKHQESPVRSVAAPQSVEQPAPAKKEPAKQAGVVVPGGVSTSSPNPSTYFRSKYHGTGSKDTPSAPAQPIYSQPPTYSAGSSKLGQRPGGRNKLLVIAGSAAVVVLIIVGYIFGVYVPNKPENAYNTGMERTGKALDSIVNSATNSDTLDKLLKSEGTGTFEAKIDNETISGTVASKMDHSKISLDLNATSKISGKPDRQYTVAALADLSSDSSKSAIYFKSDGLGFFGLEGLIPNLVNYDGKWVSIQGDYSKKLVHKYATMIGDQLAPGPLNSADGSASNTGEISNQDVADLAATFTDTTRTYLLTSDTDKAVLVNKEYVGKEDTDAGKAYHYKVGINKDNYAAYCKALSDGLIDSNFYQKLNGIDPQSIAGEKANGQAACDQSKDSIKSTDTLDLWIDAKYKLIYKIKFTDSQDTANYFEVGQNYKGKDNLQLFYNYASSTQKAESHAVYGVNLKTAESELKLDLSSGDATSKSSLVLNMTSKPFDGSVTVTKPAGATPLNTITKQSGQDLNSLIDPDAGLVPKNKVN